LDRREEKWENTGPQCRPRQGPAGQDMTDNEHSLTPDRYRSLLMVAGK
jgi:hypothetical protein